MEIVADTLILLVVLQTALRLSQWTNRWLRLAYCLMIGIIVWLSTNYAVGLSKPQVEGWLHDTTILQNVAVVCLLDALLCRLRWYPGLLILPAAFYVLCQMLFSLTGVSFQSSGLMLAVAFTLLLLCLSKAMAWLLPQDGDRSFLHTIITILLCLTCLVVTQQTVIVYPANHQNIIMEYISS